MCVLCLCAASLFSKEAEFSAASIIVGTALMTSHECSQFPPLIVFIKLSYSLLWATWRAWRRGSWCSESYKQQVSKRATAATTSWLLYPMDGGLAIGLLPTACCKYYHGLYCTYCVLRASMFCSFSLPPPHSLSFPFNSISIVHFIWFVGGLKLHLTKEKERNECRTVLVPVVMPWPHRTVAPPSVVFGQFWIPRNNRK